MTTKFKIIEYEELEIGKVLARKNPKKGLTKVRIDSLILKVFNRECKHKDIDRNKLLQAFMFDYVTNSERLTNFK